MNSTDKLAKIAINKSLLKEYSNSSNERIVYLNDGSEFQIQIFNPYSYVIAVSFEFNDTYNWSAPLLVLKPGERVWLERYLDDKKKLLFSTYQVGASKEVQEAIKNNGKITIKFFKEKVNYISNVSVYTGDNISWEPYSNKLEYTTTCKNYNDAVSSSNYINSFTCASTLDLDSVSTASSALTKLCDSSVTCSASTSASYDASSAIKGSKSRGFAKSTSKSIETGRIEKGNYSSQNFINVNYDFETWAFKTEIIMLYPMSRKPVSSNDLTKKYCYNCGRKLSQKYTYCPFCGAKQ